MAEKKGIAAKAADLARDIVEEAGLYLWDVEFVKEGSEYILRYTIDSDEGITINDCEFVHRAVDPLLDEADFIETSYRLEVSSPGIERELKREDHFLAFIGEKIKVRTYSPINGTKTLIGILKDYTSEGLSLDMGESTLLIEKKNIAKAENVYDFD